MRKQTVKGYNNETVYLIVSIDTEEDDWGVYKQQGQHLTNIGHLPELQRLFDRYKIKPTYLVTYPVAADETYRDFFKSVHNSGRAEIGAHLHPWNTPPFEEEPTKYYSMMNNLSPDLQKRKIISLTEFIQRNFRVQPRSFRAGRFCFNEQTLPVLVELNYSVDCSVTPFVDWKENYGGINFHGYPYYPYLIALDQDLNCHSPNGTFW